jgi:hypothetical protein
LNDGLRDCGGENPELGQVGFSKSDFGFATFVFLAPDQFEETGSNLVAGGGVVKRFEEVLGLYHSF